MSARMVSARELVGKTITAFDPGAGKPDGKDPNAYTMHSPSITLSDGSRLWFRVEEHPEGGEYGVFIGRTKAKGT